MPGLCTSASALRNASRELVSSLDFASAVRTAIEYEVRMRDLYLDAAKRAKEETRRSIFQKLASDEAYHLEHLKKRLGEWIERGSITAEKLRAATPAREMLHLTLNRVRDNLTPDEFENELSILQKAHAAETDALVFFTKLVDEVRSEDQKRLFENILSAEEAHVAIVKSELDYALMGKKSGWVETDEDSS